MKILFATSECAPYSKSGGLADVAYSLPPALMEAGNDVEIITPLYRCVRNRFSDQIHKTLEVKIALGDQATDCAVYRGDLNGVPIWFVENDRLFDRKKLYGYNDDKYRFAWFSKAVVDLMEYLSFIPDILHCNDWETALAVIYLKDNQAKRPIYRNVKTVYTIHNIAYQGQFGRNELESTFALAAGWYDGGLSYIYEGREDVNLMKGAMLMADAVSTVSPTYALELHTHEFGKGLEGVCDLIEAKMYGILNGIDPDLYDPSKDERIPANFSVDDTSGKDKCKEYLQETFGLKKRKGWPLYVVVARLVEQKGVDLIAEQLDRMMRRGVQLIIFGQGDTRYIDYFRSCLDKYPGQFGFSDDYTEEMAAKVFAGADFYLMPSAFEPCGLSQMMAMRYGTIPIVHETGGLKDTVRPYSDFDGIGDGFSFSQYTSKAMMLAIDTSIRVYFAERKTFEKIRERCMKKDFSWTKSADTYIKMYSDICGSGFDPNVTFKDAFDALKVVYEDLEESRNAYIALQPDDYQIIAQIRIEGPGEGTYYVKFDKNGMEMEPYDYVGADVVLTSTIDNLYNMSTGVVNPDRLYVNGQLKVRGNVSKGAELKYLIGKAEF